MFNDHGNNQTTRRLNSNRCPNQVGVAEKEAFGSYFWTIRHVRRQNTKKDSEDTQLNVTNPYRDLTSLENLLEIDTSQAAQRA